MRARTALAIIAASGTAAAAPEVAPNFVYAQGGNTVTTTDDTPQLTPAECADRAINPSLLPEAGGRFLNRDGTRARIYGINTEDLPDECDRVGVRAVYSFLEYSRSGKFRKSSNSVVVTGNSAGTFSGNVKSQPLSNVRGTRRPRVRLSYLIKFDAQDDTYDRTGNVIHDDIWKFDK